MKVIYRHFSISEEYIVQIQALFHFFFLNVKVMNTCVNVKTIWKVRRLDMAGGRGLKDDII